MVQPTDVKVRYPQFSSYADSLLMELIADAKQETPPQTWKGLRDRAVKLLVAHWLTLDQQSQSEMGGALSLIDKGDKQPRFESKTNSLQRTVYGKEFLRLRQERLQTIGARMI